MVELLEIRQKKIKEGRKKTVKDSVTGEYHIEKYGESKTITLQI